MKHFGIFISDLESERFMSATNDQITTWLFLHAFCSKQTNGGIITGAATLQDRFWSRHGISYALVMTPSPLWSWNDDALTVEPYDIDGESLYLKKVKGGKDGAYRRWKETVNRSPNGSPYRPNLTLPNQTLPNPTDFALNGASSDSPLKISWNSEIGFSGITEKDRAEWKEAFPAVNIDQQLAAASLWLKNNPSKRKKLIGKFITGWFMRHQERGGDISSNKQSPQAPKGYATTGGRTYKP